MVLYKSMMSHNTSRWSALGKALHRVRSQATLTPKVDSGPHLLTWILMVHWYRY